MASAAKPIVHEIAAAGPVELALLPMTDLGNAERFVERFGKQFKYTTAKGWLGWDGRRWRVLDQEDKVTPAEVQEAVFKTVRAIQDEAAALAETGIYFEETNPTGRDKWVHPPKDGELLSTKVSKHGRASEGAAKLSCIPNLAKRWLTVPIEAFDKDPDAINTLSGTVKIIRLPDGRFTARLLKHDRADLITRLAPVEFDAAPFAAPLPVGEGDLLPCLPQASVYDEFFAWAQPEAEMRRYLHAWGGYSATGHIGEQKLQFWYGKGANGKSTLIDAWAHALGDYAGTIGIETFLDQGIKKRGDAATPDLARLGGVRMLRASEPERGARLNEALVKAATGGEPMAVRMLHKGFYDLVPQFKLTIGGNYRPDVPGTDEGIWRRLKLVPWQQYRAENERDDDLPNKLRAEASGIFARLIAGAVDWYNNGLIEPEAVTAATADYRDESDPLARFLSMCTRADMGGRVQSSVLYELFCAWCKAAGEKEWSTKGFSKAMLDKGIRKKQANGIFWLDIATTKDRGDFIDADGRVRLTEDDGLPVAPSHLAGGGKWDDGLDD